MPRIERPFRVGSLVYHGTSADEEFERDEDLRGPAWVSDSRIVAESFVGWNTGSRPRVLTYRVIAEPKLVVAVGEGEFQDMLEWIDEETGLSMSEGWDPHELAEAMCSIPRVDGWHLPLNFPKGSDTLLCEPGRFLELVSSEPVAKKRRNPLVDSEVLAQRLYDAMPFPAIEIPLSQVNLSTSDRGHPVVDEPERYRWFLIPEFPVQAFGLRLEDLLRDTNDPWYEKRRHDKIVDLLRSAPAWPAVVTATGVLVDGFHRVTANRTLRRRTMPVVVAVERSGTDSWDDLWLGDDSELRRNSGAARAVHYIHVISDGPLVIARLPWPMPRWKAVLGAVTGVMREHGLRQKDASIESLTAAPGDEWSDDDRAFAAKLDAAFAGDASAVAKFWLYDWRDGRFELVRRPATKRNSDADLRRLERAARAGDPQAAERLHAARIRTTGVVPESHRIGMADLGVFTPHGAVLCPACSGRELPAEVDRDSPANARCDRCGVPVRLWRDDVALLQQLRDELRVVHGIDMRLWQTGGMCVALGMQVAEVEIMVAVDYEGHSFVCDRGRIVADRSYDQPPALTHQGFGFPPGAQWATVPTGMIEWSIGASGPEAEEHDLVAQATFRTRTVGEAAHLIARHLRRSPGVLPNPPARRRAR